MPWYEAVGGVSLVFVCFAVLHSVFATETVKNLCEKYLGETFVQAFYRLLYTILSLATTGLAVRLALEIPDVDLYRLSGWPAWLLRLIQLGGIVLMVFAFRAFSSLGEFTGISQAIRFIKTGKVRGDVEGLTEGRLVTKGIFGIVRNPIYLAGVVVISCTPHMTRNWLAVVLLADMYFVYGAWIEEKRLLKRFGPEYGQYMKEVPLLIPSASLLLRVLREKWNKRHGQAHVRP